MAQPPPPPPGPSPFLGASERGGRRSIAHAAPTKPGRGARLIARLRGTSRNGLTAAAEQKLTSGDDDLDEDELLALGVAEQHVARRERAASGSVAAPGDLAAETAALAADPEDRAKRAEEAALMEDGEDGLWAFEAWDKAEGGEPL